MFDRFGNTDILMTFQMRKESIGRKINNYVLKLRSQKLRVVYFYLYFIPPLRAVKKNRGLGSIPCSLNKCFKLRTEAYTSTLGLLFD